MARLQTVTAPFPGLCMAAIGGIIVRGQLTCKVRDRKPQLVGAHWYMLSWALVCFKIY